MSGYVGGFGKVEDHRPNRPLSLPSPPCSSGAAAEVSRNRNYQVPIAEDVC